MPKKTNKRLIAQAPTRIDLAGGTLDISPLYIFARPALTVNIAINRYATVAWEPLPGPKLKIHSLDLNCKVEFSSTRAMYPKAPLQLILEYLAAYRKSMDLKRGFSLQSQSGVPTGSGLGGSSAMGIALSSVLRRGLKLPALSGNAMIRHCQSVECAMLCSPTGVQDFYPARFGGVQALWYKEGGVYREPMTGLEDFIQEHLVLAYTGQSHLSTDTNWKVFQRAFSGDRSVRTALHEIGQAALGVYRGLKKKNVKALADAMNEEWHWRRKLDSRIETPLMKKMIRRARVRGAMAAKACGAGGGGSLVFIVPPSRFESVKAVLRESGATLLDFKVARRGVVVRKGLD